MLENRIALVAVIGEVLGIVLGLYCKINIVLIYLLIFILVLIAFFSINNLTFSSDAEKQTIAEVVGASDYNLIVPQRLKINTKTESEMYGDITFKVKVSDYEQSGLDYVDKKDFGTEDVAIKHKTRNVYECTYRVYNSDKDFPMLDYIKSKNNETIKTVLYLAAIFVIVIIGINIKKNRSGE